MLLTLKQEHKRHIQFLTEQTPQVLQDFCKLAIDYVQRGPNVKLYAAAAQKLEVDLNIIKNSTEGLVNLLLECCKYKLNTDDFQDAIKGLGFSVEKNTILTKLYEVKREELSNVITRIGLKLPVYHNLEWRFEVKELEEALREGRNQHIRRISRAIK